MPSSLPLALGVQSLAAREKSLIKSKTHDAVGIGDAMSKILGQNVAEDAQTILAKRSTARMGEIQSDKKEIKAA
ncbi:hypothetical protein PF004_g10066 [Phytophthora fragariae]|uniref:Uncharacterized protein n=1 Tax=Phytophthora fragariae TaxID=53985 RepID=A0A6G0P1X8_9STRA|nr:hypothetical protein PF004_g10066 [Phytophthora fragariae]